MKIVATKIAEFKEDDDIASLEFSPDGAQLAVDTALKPPVHIWEWKGHPRVAQTFLKPPATGDFFFSADGLRYNLDGSLLAVTHKIARDEDGHGVVRIFDTKTGTIVHDIGELRSGGARSRIAFSPDGKSLIRTFDRFAQFPGDNLIVHRVDTWAPVWGLRTIPLDIMALALSNDGKIAAVGGMTLGPGETHQVRILLVDLVQQKLIRTINDVFPFNNSVEILAWNPDGVHIAAGAIADGTHGTEVVKVFDVTTGQQVAGEAAELAHVMALRYTPDGKYLIESGIGKTVRIWDGQHKVLIQQIPAEHSYALGVSRDSAHIAIGDGANVSVWKLN